jgi:hypothetical protein
MQKLQEQISAPGVFPRSEHHFAAGLKGVKRERKSEITLGDFEQRCFCDSPGVKYELQKLRLNS